MRVDHSLGSGRGYKYGGERVTGAFRLYSLNRSAIFNLLRRCIFDCGRSYEVNGKTGRPAYELLGPEFVTSLSIQALQDCRSGSIWLFEM